MSLKKDKDGNILMTYFFSAPFSTLTNFPGTGIGTGIIAFIFFVVWFVLWLPVSWILNRAGFNLSNDFLSIWFGLSVPLCLYVVRARYLFDKRKRAIVRKFLLFRTLISFSEFDRVQVRGKKYIKSIGSGFWGRSVAAPCVALIRKDGTIDYLTEAIDIDEAVEISIELSQLMSIPFDPPKAGEKLPVIDYWTGEGL